MPVSCRGSPLKDFPGDFFTVAEQYEDRMQPSAAYRGVENINDAIQIDREVALNFDGGSICGAIIYLSPFVKKMSAPGETREKLH